MKIHELQLPTGLTNALIDAGLEDVDALVNNRDWRLHGVSHKRMSQLLNAVLDLRSGELLEQRMKLEIFSATTGAPENIDELRSKAKKYDKIKKIIE
jgi:hypothetical protein